MKRLFLQTLLVASTFGCGSKGGSDDPQGSTEPGTVGGGGGAVENAPEVSGAFFIGTTETPAAGYELWLLDHTTHELARFPVTASGAVKIALENFTDGDVYSLHLVGGFRLLGTFDLSPTLAGAQEAIKYEGGYGFSLGEQVVSKDAFGRIVVPVALQAQVGGGFSLAADASGALSDLGVPSDVKALLFGSQLLVFDPLTLLNGFYNKGTNPSTYASALGAASRIKISLEGANETALTRSFALDAGAWLATSRLAASDEQGRSEAPLWSTTNFELTAAAGGKFSASVFTGAPLDAGTLVALKVQPAVGAQLNLPVHFERIFSVPPLVTAISPSGGTPVAISYTSTTAQNGLTRPFCHTSGDVALKIAMPLDQAGTSWTEEAAPYIDAVFDYYADTAGKTTAVTPAATDFAASHQASYTDQAGSGGFLESWDVATRTLRLTAPAASAAAATHTVTLPAELLPTSAGGSTLSLVRIKLIVRWKDKGAESGAVVWLKKGC